MAIERTDTLTLAGVTYPFRTPKVAIVLSALMRLKGITDETEKISIMVTAQAEWVLAGIGQEAWDDVERRMLDPEDPIDWPDIAKAFEEKVSLDAGRPTMSPAESSAPSPATTLSEEKPSRSASMFGL